MAEKIELEKLQNLKVWNMMEIVVEDNFAVVLQKFPNSCHCEQCLADIKALALNNLKPHYVATDKGGVYERVNLSGMLSKIDVLRAMTEAAEKVAAHPHHVSQNKE